jgi:hypothetical protein
MIVSRLFALATALWFATALISVTGTGHYDVDNVDRLALLAALGQIGFWIGNLVAGAGLLLLVLDWDRRYRTDVYDDESVDDRR